MKVFLLICLLAVIVPEAPASASQGAPTAKDFPKSHPLRLLLEGQSQCAHPGQSVDISIFWTPQIQAETELLMHFVGDTAGVSRTYETQQLLSLKTGLRGDLQDYYEQFSLNTDGAGKAELAVMENNIQDKRKRIAELEAQLRRSPDAWNALYSLETYRKLSQEALTSKALPVLQRALNEILAPLYKEIYHRPLKASLREKLLKNLQCDMTPAEILSLIYYTGEGYAPINRALRKQTVLEEPLSSNRIVMDSALTKLKPYLGITKRGASFLDPQQWARQEISDPAYLSTSILYKQSFPGHQFTIHSRTCRWIALYSVNFGEDEVLCPRGLSFKVRGHRPLKEGEPQYESSQPWLAVEMEEI